MKQDDDDQLATQIVEKVQSMHWDYQLVAGSGSDGHLRNGCHQKLTLITKLTAMWSGRGRNVTFVRL